VRTIGLTGGAASGKSTVAAVWRESGVEVVDADAMARSLLDEDRDLRRALAIEFGEEVLEGSANADTGRLDRAELARRAFASPERTRALNRLVHPPLRAPRHERLALARASGAPLVAVDAALIFELGLELLFDEVVLVTAPEPQRLERVRARGLDDATARGLLASQLPDEVKAARASRVIVNDGTLDDLRRAAAAALEAVGGPAAGPAARAGPPSGGRRRGPGTQASGRPALS
jgi:dephospho-CoA kinase